MICFGPIKMSLPYKFSASTLIKEGRCSEEDVDEVKKWLSTTDYPQLPDELIVLIILSCENVLERVQKTINAYFRVKNNAPELFSNRDVDEEKVRKATRTLLTATIPTKMKNNPVIHFFRMRDTDYRNFDLAEVLKLSYMLVDVSQFHDPPNEMILVIDMAGVSFMHLTCVNFSVFRKSFDFLQEAMPLKMSAIHVLNANYVFDKLFSLIKVFIKSDLVSIIKMYPPSMKMEDFLKEHVPAEYMPKEYGGKLPSAEELNERTVEQYRELKEFFELEEKFRKQYKTKI